MLEELSHLENRLRYALAKDVVFEVALIQMSQLKEKFRWKASWNGWAAQRVRPHRRVKR